jgi:hypothetical protein
MKPAFDSGRAGLWHGLKLAQCQPTSPVGVGAFLHR